MKRMVAWNIKEIQVQAPRAYESAYLRAHHPGWQAHITERAEG